jgi:hypothetical protein
MRFITPLLCLALMAINQLSAEGTRQVAPNGNIDIMVNATPDIAALHINNPSYNNFAAFNSANPLSRLYIHIKDPSTECIYLGFNWAHNNVTSPAPPRINFQYQIKDPNGNVVFGPILVTPNEANIQSWSEGFTGPMQLFGPSGYNATQVTSTALGAAGWSGKGDYYIEFRDDENNDLLIDFWDITVADCSTPSPAEKTGRVWSYNWSFFAVNDFGFPNRPFNGAFYVCAPDPDNNNASFVTKIDFNQSGFRPAAFNVAFNSFGSMNSGDVSMDRRSVQNMNATQAEYAIFLNDPIDICETASIGEVAVLGVSRCDGENYCIKFTTTKAGQVDLLLDFDGPDNMYTPGTADVLISRTVTADEVGIPSCVEWNGLDGLGNQMAENVATQIPITIAYAQGIYHFPIYDAEFMTNGFMISAVRPAAAVSLLFYDDSNIGVPSGSGEPAVQLTGCMPPCHRWTNYTQPNTIGFGNLNTINSWWFSQLIIRQDVFFLPSYYACEVEGPERFCAGGTTELNFNPVLYPEGAAENEIISTVWTGPGIVGANNTSTVTINDGGTYFVEVTWLTSLGDTCRTTCEHSVTIDPPLTSSIDTLIIQGETIDINGETYSEAGQYIQTFTSSEGCDSILTITIIVLNTIIHYDLNACESFMSNGSHMDYSEFVASYPQPLTCATIVAENLHRENPQVNKHSCTPGVEDSPGMCVVALPGCTYIAGHEASVVIEINVTPDPDTAVHLTGFSFYEKAPATYEWISGSSGPNNYPTLFQVRVLKNGSEIFLSPATPTSLVWQQVVYDFLDNDDFLVKDPTTFRFELLGYCPVGNGAVESVWDLDEIDIMASCASLDGLNKNIAGIVTTVNDVVVPGVKMHLYGEPTLDNALITTTETNGQYFFGNLLPESDYYITANKDDDHLNGVNTLDLILIQKHLLGVRPFVSPYQKIAADANRNNSITVLDLIEIRKLLLGIYTEFPNNTSWRFGITGQELPLYYPWVMESTYGIESLDDHITDANFIGIKIGDVNSDVNPDFTSGGFIPRGDNTLVLTVSDQEIAAGITTIVDITSDQFTDIAGLQLSLEMKNGRILDVVSGAIEMRDEFFSIASDGSLLMSWNERDMLTVPSDQVLFSLKVVSEVSGTSQELLRIRETGLSSEVYVGEFLEKLFIELESETTILPGFGNVLFPNKPNPFSQFTTIQFKLEQAGRGTLRFYDLAGRVLYVETDDFVKGLNTFELSTDKLGIQSGIVICQLQSEGFVATQKMVVVRE